MQIKFPIKYFSKNLIINSQNDCYAIYRIESFDYDFCNVDKKFQILNTLTKFISDIGEEAKIIVVPILVNYDEYFSKMKFRLEGTSRVYSLSRKHLDMANEFVNNNYHDDNVNDYQAYVMTKLDKSLDFESIKETIGKIVTEPVDVINQWFGVGKEISKRKLMKYQKLADEYEKQQGRRMKIIPCSEIDIQWLIKKSFFRGCKDEIKTWDKWKPYYKITKTKDDEVLDVDENEMMLTLSSGELNLEEKRVVKVIHDEEVSYQTFVIVSKIPDEIYFPGNEFLLYPQQMDFPVETCITINSVPYSEAVKKLERKKRTIKSQMEHIGSNDNDMPEEVILARENIEGLESEIKSNSTPLSKVSICFCITASEREELEDRVKVFMQFYKDSNMGVERPVADQYKLFMEFFPGTNRYDNNFILPVVPRLIAGGMIGATSDLGDNVGCYIGRGGILEKPVFLDLLHACQLNKPAATFILGAQGYGKTFNSNLLVYNHVLLLYARAFIIDPKGDRKDWCKKLPELSAHINIIQFRANKDKGKLDPFIIYKENMNEAGDLCINLLTELFNISSDSLEYLALQDSVEKVKESENPSMKLLSEKLLETNESDPCRERAMLLSRKISNLNKGGLQNLLFSDGNVEALNFDKKINIVMVENLKLPLSTMAKTEYNSEEKLGTVLMLAIANFAKRFSQMSPMIKKIIVMDEAWALAKTSQGVELFERLARTGRSLNTSTIFIGHSSKDLTNEGIRNSIRYKFVFNVTNREEAIRALEFLDMDITEENISLLSSDERGLENGECIFSDVQGRKGILRFDAVDEKLIEAFRTTPPSGEKSEVVI